MVIVTCIIHAWSAAYHIPVCYNNKNLIIKWCGCRLKLQVLVNYANSHIFLLKQFRKVQSHSHKQPFCLHFQHFGLFFPSYLRHIQQSPSVGTALGPIPRRTPRIRYLSPITLTANFKKKFYFLLNFCVRV